MSRVETKRDSLRAAGWSDLDTLATLKQAVDTVREVNQQVRLANEQVSDTVREANQQVRLANEQVTKANIFTNRVEALLYMLARDCVPCGIIEEYIKQIGNQKEFDYEDSAGLSMVSKWINRLAK